ncbi:MAG TPA: FtsX-like permease family protein [Casimicrobiaceae bacterium]|jgi:putative ABC transport system permease protein|nr:FtsX-like permease family protein [Casimicrobiaceae bacterium]
MSVSTLTLALRNLPRHRGRTLISLSAVAFGVVALLLAGGFVEWVFWAMREAAIQTGLGHIQVSRVGYRERGAADPSAFVLPAADCAAAAAPCVPAPLRDVPHVVAVDPRLAVSGLASNGDTTVPFVAEAVDPDADRAIARVLEVQGERLSASSPDGVLLGRGLAKTLAVGIGGRVSFIVTVPGGGINAVEGTVRGVFATQVKAYDDTAVRMPIALGQKLLRTSGAHVWVVGLDDTVHTDEVRAYLAARLPADRYEIATWHDLSDFYRKSVVLLSRQIAVVGLMIAAMIVLGISNTMTMNVLERTGEIGTMLAIGTRRRAVLWLFVLEGLLLGLVGAGAGLAIGYGLAHAISYVGIPMPPPPGREAGYLGAIILTPTLVAAGLAMATFAAVLASLYPSWKAARMPIVDALRQNR